MVRYVIERQRFAALAERESDHANGPISAGGRGIASTLTKRSGTPLIPARISGEERRNPLDHAEVIY